MINLRSPSVDNSDDGIVIKLDNDDTDIGSTHSTGTFGNDGVSRHSSIGSRTDSSRKSSRARTQESTDKPYLGAQRRYPGRTGIRRAF